MSKYLLAGISLLAIFSNMSAVAVEPSLFVVCTPGNSFFDQIKVLDDVLLIMDVGGTPERCGLGRDEVCMVRKITVGQQRGDMRLVNSLNVPVKHIPYYLLRFHPVYREVSDDTSAVMLHRHFNGIHHWLHLRGRIELITQSLH
jgi:hypothetical protein